MRVTQKGQVTIPLEVRQALAFVPGSDVQFELDRDGARLVVGREHAAGEIARMRVAGDVDLSTDVSRRSLPDFLIGAHAAVTKRPLLTRDPRRIAAYIPGAAVISPESH